MKIFLSLFFSTLTIVGVTAQDILPIYQKAKVVLIDKNIQELTNLGVETDHGVYAKGRFFINTFSKKEVEFIQESGFEVEILIEDVVKHYEEEVLHEPINRQKDDCFPEVTYDYETPLNYKVGSMGGYLTYQELMEELDKMHSLYPSLISEKTAIDDYTTVEGNKIYFLRLTDNPDVDEGEPQVIYTALHHAREPNGLSQMMFYIWYLLENYDTNDEVKFLVDNTDMHFIPCVNPDGYMYNELIAPNGGGGWRKNRRDNEDGNFGVDLNRNYGFLWGFNDEGSSPQTDASTYRGPSAFSEEETQAVAFHCEANNFQVALNYHTFGNLLIHPWGYNDAITEDHDTFVAIGNLMIQQNKYHVGTGLETVGYLVNGDTDDWMYGEEASKNKIFSLTPEVGPSFWPNPNLIDELNKSCVFQNLTAAHVLHSYGSLEEVAAADFYLAGENKFEVKLTNVGLQAGDFTVDFEVQTELDTFMLEQVNVSLPSFDDLTIIKTFDLDNLPDESSIKIVAIANNTNFSNSVSFEKQFNAQVETIDVFADASNNLDNWETEILGWGIDTSIYFSSPASFADSPDSNYGNNQLKMITLKNSLLVEEGSSAFLEFRAKWDIENEYDYVQVMISTNGIDFTPLCGKYTNVPSVFQPQGEPLYDGQSDWVLEKISLSNYIGQNIWVRFQLFSDGFVNGAGFNFDDLRVVVKEPETTSVKNNIEPTINYTLFPNPTNQNIFIRTNNLDILQQKFEVYTMLGKLVLSDVIYSNNQEIKISGLLAGQYLLKVQSGKSQKFTIIK